MATLQTIRNRGGLLVSIVIGLALIAFIVGDALSSGSRILNGSRNQVGEIAGKDISIIDYQNQIAKNEEMVKSMNNTSLNDEQQTMLRENTWQQMMREILMNQEFDELGINVSGDELYDMMLGNNMSPEISRLFANENGEVDYDRARNTIKSLMELPGSHPQKMYWLNLEEETATSRQMEKYSNLLAKSMFITDAQAKENAENSASRSDISYIVKNYSTIDDSTINVTSAEIKEYYNNNQKRFEQPEEARSIIYVNFDIAPSAEDYSETEKMVIDMIPEFTTSQEPLDFVNLSSDKKADKDFYAKTDIVGNDSLAEFLFSGKGGVFGPYLENNAYKISRVASEKMLSDSVRARHILIQENDFNHAQKLADSLASLVRKGADFEQLAKSYSKDQGSAINGGDLGWFSPKQMVQPFSDSAFFAKKNDVKVVATQYGIHVLQVTDMSKQTPKIQVATIEKEVQASPKTTNKIYNDARTFATGVKTVDDFNKKVSEAGLTKRMANVNKNERTIAGMDNARDMIRQIYMSDKPGHVVLTNDGTEIFENGNKYTIAILTDIVEEGITPLNSAASNIKRILVQKKKAEMLKKELEAAISGSGSLLSVAQKAGLEVKEASEVSFNSFQIPGAGVEPNVIAAASLSEQGKISAPIEGNMGVYVIMVNNRTQEEVTPEMIAATKQGLLQSNMYRANYQAFQAIMKNGEVKDMRYKFY